MNNEEKQRIKKLIESKFSINNLDDMAKMFFKIARSIGHPLDKMDLILTRSWGDQYKKDISIAELNKGISKP